jgi:hypothetical protein
LNTKEITFSGFHKYNFLFIVILHRLAAKKIESNAALQRLVLGHFELIVMLQRGADFF